MNEKQLKDIFKQGYNFQYWKQVLDFVFGKVEYFSTPNNPFTEDKKVISGKQYGRIKLEDAKSIALFEVEVDDSVDIERNRQGLREIAAKHIDQNITHGAIVFFHSPTQENYRFTFIAKWSDIDLETGELQKGETQKKRYTYLLGSNQSGTTAAKRLLELANRKPVIAVKDIIQAFSVEALTKEFFKKYKEHYERFWRFIDDKPAYQKLLLDNADEKNDDEKRKPIRDFSKKLLGRIVFLHFLQKKGWMGCPMLSTKKDNDEIWIDGNPNFIMELFRNFTDKEHFYSKCLTALFFNTLNEPERTNNVFSITNNRVPYLNGGLFDNDQQHTDGINFPANYFQELLEFFEQYNFTIDENSPDEQEVGIDPEMLGHIFENLLEENREKGAFYTPKEIVHYMCQESLVQYLKNHLPEEAQVEDFIRQQNVSAYLRDKANAIQLNQLLDEVKVCDPAIGSGAFPIGILQEIYKAKIHIYPYLQTLTAFDPAETKKKIIEESIYGVDLEHGAVEIARLRFWLALVVDEDKPQPLPNLDYKIMQGNSLLERFEGIDLSMVTKTKKNIKVVEPERDLFGNITDNQMKMTFTQTETVKEIQGLMKKYFNVKKPSDKAVLKTKINDAVHKHIDVNLELREGQLARLISEAENERALNTKGQKKLEELKKELASFAQKRAKLHKIQNTEEKPYFIWHLFFKDVFDKGGFDIVIGNPPYIQIQKLGNDIEVLSEANFKTFAKTGDIYCLFYEKGNSLLKDKGNLCFITSNKWMNAAYGKIFRKFLLDETNPILLIDFSKAVIFPAAVVFVNILQFRKEKKKNELIGVKADADFQIGKIDLFKYVINNLVYLNNLTDENWTVAEKQDFEITKKIDDIGTPLKNWDLNFFRGITSGLNEAFHITEQEKEGLINDDNKNADLIKPLLRGKDIKRYTYTFDNRYILFIPWHFPLDPDEISTASQAAENEFIQQYPAVYNHLSKYKPELSARNASETGIRYEWYALQRYGANFWREFEKDKIVWIEISDRANYCLDTNKHYLTNSAYFLTGSNLKYLLALLNSKLIDFYFYQKTAQIAGGRKRYTKQYVELLPIKQIKDVELISKFETIVEYIIFLNDEKSPQVNIYTENISLIPLFEDLINMMVYELYFEDHMKDLEINVLKFIQLGKEFKLLEEGNYSKNKNAIAFAYQWLQERENPIRSRIILSNIRSKEVIAKINSTTL